MAEMMTPDPIVVAAATQMQIATLTAQVASIRGAIAAGLDSASYDGKSVHYRSLNEMKQALNFAEAQLNALVQPGYRKPQAGFATFTRGR